MGNRKPGTSPRKSLATTKKGAIGGLNTNRGGLDSRSPTSKLSSDRQISSLSSSK